MFKLIESDCEQGNLPNDCTDCCQTIGYDVNILQKLDFEARSFYNLQIEGSNLGPWRKTDNDDTRSNTYRKSAQDRLRIQGILKAFGFFIRFFATYNLSW